MEIPRPGPQHAVLARLSGKWIGDETMMPSPWSPEKKKCKARLEARMLDDFFLITDYQQKVGNKVNFRGHGVFGWDPQKKHFLMYWFDSMGGPGGVATGILEGDNLTFQNTTPMGHNRYRYTFGDRAYSFEIAMSADGQSWKPIMIGQYRPA